MMIIAKATEENYDWEYTDSMRNHLYFLLNDTIYSLAKRKEFEYLIEGNLSQTEYENFKYQFKQDKKDSITMKGTGSQTEIKNRIGKLK